MVNYRLTSPVYMAANTNHNTGNVRSYGGSWAVAGFCQLGNSFLGGEGVTYRLIHTLGQSHGACYEAICRHGVHGHVCIRLDHFLTADVNFAFQIDVTGSMFKQHRPVRGTRMLSLQRAGTTLVCPMRNFSGSSSMVSIQISAASFSSLALLIFFGARIM